MDPHAHKHCLRCGYILDGLPEPRCPECSGPEPRRPRPQSPERHVAGFSRPVFAPDFSRGWGGSQHHFPLCFLT